MNEKFEIHPSHAVHIVDGELACRRCMGCKSHYPNLLLEKCKCDLLSKGSAMDHEIRKDRYILTIDVYSKNEEYLQSLAAYILKDLTISADDPDHASEVSVSIEKTY